MADSKPKTENVDKQAFFTDLQKGFEKNGQKVSRSSAKNMFDMCIEAAIKSAASVGSFRYSHGMGALKVRQLGASIRRNPKTGEKINVPARKVFRYVAGKEAKKLLN